MALLEEMCRVTGADPEDVIGTELSETPGETGATEKSGLDEIYSLDDENDADDDFDDYSDTGQDETGQMNTRQLNTDAEEAAGDEYQDSPGCLFYSCFACEDGRCTALKDNDFNGRPCPFFKTAEKVKKERQDAFDRLLIDRRLDLINRYEEVNIALGIEDPEDALVPIDDDVLKARRELEQFREELEKSETGDPGKADTDDDYDFDDLIGADGEDGLEKNPGKDDPASRDSGDSADGKTNGIQ